ncbi:MAG: carbon-nitrogen hydrolase family protein [Opitutaceae bacterium]
MNLRRSLHRCRTGALLSLASAAIAGATPAGQDRAPDPTVPVATARREGLPRKVLIGTVVCGESLASWPLDRRLQKMVEDVDDMAAQARTSYPGKRLDLVVLPEAFIARPGDTVAAEAVRLSEVQDAIGACARSHGCYLIAPALLNESNPQRYSNTAVLVDRSGRLVGIYRKVHPVAPQGSDVIETGTTPGAEFPVFDCDFGRVGIQICFDMLYRDGWDALARKGAEIVALPSASPQTSYPSFYAMEHRYYVVSAAPRDHAAFYSPLGVIEAEATKESTLVHEIDLSYALLHWEAALEEGGAFKRRFGDKAGFHYYRDQDTGIFWSNDPAIPIGKMIASLGLVETAANVERIRELQDRARGGPPEAP